MMHRRETDLLIKLEGAVNLASAEELKSLLLEGLVSGRDVHLDLERAEEIDVTVLQLLWAAGREADCKGQFAAIHSGEGRAPGHAARLA